jgi:putative transposase
VPYSRTFFHIVWTTKNRHPRIGELEQEIIRRSLTSTFDDMDVIPQAVGYMPDHVHVIVSIPPKIVVADLVRRMKGASAPAVNQDRPRLEQPSFGWKDEYGVHTFGEKALPDVISYVEN